MLTRLKVNGFKNLVDVDVRFGPFTCIAGVNGSGKSNLFDAIRFLSALAEKPLVGAALSIVRGSGGRSADIRGIFHHVGDEHAKEMSFKAEMIVPTEGIDDLGQTVKATSTFLRYSLTIGYRGYDGPPPYQPLEILREELVALPSGSAQEALGFLYRPIWRKSAIRNHSRTCRAFVSTLDDRNGARVIRVHCADNPDRTVDRFADALPRTVLSSTDASDSPTVVLAQHEMRSWQVLQLDPATMRKPDSLEAPKQLGSDGAHLAATLYSVAHAPPANGRDPYEAETAVYARVGGRLFDLLREIRDIVVERDEKREELTLVAKERDGTTLSARALSDGTLRFLALVVLEQQEESGLFCIEEPENGIHPGRISALLRLLQGIALDTTFPIEGGNPLRQVIISTHSPSIVMRVPEDSLVVAELWPSHDDRGRFKRARFRGLVNTWRDPSPDRKSVALGTLLDYLNPEGYRPLPEPDPERGPDAEVRVMDRADLHELFSPTPRLDG